MAPALSTTVMTPKLPALLVFLVLFTIVTVVGFAATHWRKASLDHLLEWGLAGQRLGGWLTWFLLGGDLYTAYTFIAVPALIFGAGALGFFALPYTIMAFPLALLALPRLWQVCHQHGYLTTADFVKGRYGSRLLALIVAATGIVATLPYIALQLIGIEVVLAALGFPISGPWSDLPLIAAFAILAGYTYTSGLRAPALISIIKDSLIYVTALACIVIIPIHLGGYGRIFASVPPAKLLLPAPGAHSLGSDSAFITLALGSALALFLYPHATTGVLSAKNPAVIRRNMTYLPAYSFVLGLLGFLGFMAIAARHELASPAFAPAFHRFGANFAVPALLLANFPSWFVGIALSAIAIGALVPAAIMSIASASLFTRNIYCEYLHQGASEITQARVAKWVSLVVKLGALLFVLAIPFKYAIDFQLLGGIWIIQLLPAIAVGLYRRCLHPWALMLGWLCGTAVGTGLMWANHFTSAVYVCSIGGETIPVYIAILAVGVNFAITALFTFALQVFPSTAGLDETHDGDYTSA
ncbi:sodium/proline symporter [mine drainage metagenome]|uniref:Sodium/proline symporter n=1 Tax=mine drainage metagenome TaxID=410659 RepID=T1BVB9_9ZZZZ